MQRYDANLPGWQMRPSDQFFVGDFNGDKKADLFVFNGGAWAIPYLGMLASNGTSLSMAKRYDGNMPDWQMRPPTSISSAISTETARRTFTSSTATPGRSPTGHAQIGWLLVMVQRYDGNAPGWQMRTHDATMSPI